jgi:hypothetical protein
MASDSEAMAGPFDLAAMGGYRESNAMAGRLNGLAMGDN